MSFGHQRIGPIYYLEVEDFSLKWPRVCTVLLMGMLNPTHSVTLIRQWSFMLTSWLPALMPTC